MDVPELIPIDQYDPKKARLEALINWLLTKAFGNNIPSDLQDPFYAHDKGGHNLKPTVVNGLTTSDFYCRVCDAIFRGSSSEWQGHASVLQALSRKGIYVLEPNESAVTETVLLQTTPFKLSSHLAMIEALMLAYAKEVVSVERVVQAVRKFTTFTASSELPYDVEEALLFWMNKVCATMRHHIDKENAAHGQRQPSDIPVMDDLLKDLNDGCCLATLISFYAPRKLKVTDIAISSSLGIADSLYNLQLVMEFCVSCLPCRSLHMTINDLFYTNVLLKPTLVAFLAELFYWVEVNRVPCVRDVSRPLGAPEEEESQETETEAMRAMARKPPLGLPISNATKRSFQQSGELWSGSSSSTPDLHNMAGSSPTLPAKRQPLLPKRLQQRNSTKDDEALRRAIMTTRMRRSHSLTSIEEREDIRQSVRAWEETSESAAGYPHNPTTRDFGLAKRSGEPSVTGPGNPRGPQFTGRSQLSSAAGSQDSRGTLLANVSIDSEMSFDDSSSMSIGELEESPYRQGIASRASQRHPAVTDPNHPDYMEVESVSSRAASASSVGRGGRPTGNPHPQEPLEPLMPAKLRPSKERSVQHTKEVESGEAKGKKSPSPPHKPRSLQLKQNGHGDGSDSSTPDEEYKTPSSESFPIFTEQPEKTTKTQPPKPSASVPQGSSRKQYEAFYVDTEAQMTNGPPTAQNHSQGPARSFTLHEQPHTRDTARVAGIPVIDGSHGSPPSRVDTRRTASGSRDGGDRELQKIYADHRDKEVRPSTKDSFYLNTDAEPPDVHRPDSLNVPKPIQVDMSGQRFSLHDVPRDERPSPKTSFAEIKKQKDNGEVSPVIYKQKPVKSSLRTEGEDNVNGNPRGSKRATFATLPNQMTWQDCAQKSAQTRDSNRDTEGTDSVQPLGTELLDIRMRLEERRRQIETKKKKVPTATLR